MIRCVCSGVCVSGDVVLLAGSLYVCMVVCVCRVVCACMHLVMVVVFVCVFVCGVCMYLVMYVPCAVLLFSLFVDR